MARFRSLAALLALALLGCGDGGGATGADTIDGADTAGASDAAADTTADVAPGADIDTASDTATGPPACGSLDYDWRGLIPGPGEEGFDAALADRAERYERSFHTFTTAAMGVNIDLTVAPADTEARAAIERFLREEDGWDFEASSGQAPMDVVTSFHKVAGLYAGVGIAADAFRYGVLRDQGYPCEDVERARAALLRALDTLHIAVDITGAEGVIVRGLHRSALPGGGYETVPLFDPDGDPLPEPKNNGTWRADFSEGGRYPGWIWEDSVSRDQYIGWVAAFAATWEVIRDDPTIPDDVKERLRADALPVALQLMVVRESGYDLELPDADGRTTLHGWLNEHNLDGQAYLPAFENGFHAVMALGIVAAWVYVTEDPELEAWLYDELIGERRLPEIVRTKVAALLDVGHKSNFSNYNMAFTGALLALRYLEDADAKAAVREALDEQMYDRDGGPWQPVEQENALFDVVYAAGMAQASASAPTPREPDAAALVSARTSFLGFPDPPYWDAAVTLCPAAECTEEDPAVDDPACTAEGGLSLTVLGCVGRNGDLVTEEPIPMAVRPPSNYHWRSNPYRPNGGGSGGTFLPGVDFRIAYWFGRWARRP